MAGLSDLLPKDIRYPQEMKCPVCLLLDISGSMSGDPIRNLNEGVSKLKDALLLDDQAKKTIELFVVTFGGVITPYPFCTPEDFKPPSYDARGDTPMGEAILLGLDLIAQRKEQYKAQGIHYYRPWVVVITDGEPTDVDNPEWREVVGKIRKAEKDKKILAWAFGVPGSNLDRLNELLSHQEPDKRKLYQLDGFDFKNLFLWLSASLGTVSRSQEGGKAHVETPPAKKIELEV